MGQPISRTPYADYLTREEESETKHEFIDGNVYAMAGGTPEHARLQASVVAALFSALQGRPCAVFTSDLRVRIDATNRTTYPDVTVVCGAVETSTVDKNAVTNPTLLVEVMSESSEADDRGDKFAHYRHLPSLREYVLVSGRSERIEVMRLNAQGRWELAEEGAPGSKVHLASVEVTLDVATIYASSLPTVETVPAG